MTEIKNRGILPPLDLSEELGAWITDSLKSISYQVQQSDGNWRQYKTKKDELQLEGGLETMACVSFSGENDIGEQINKKIREGIIDTEKIKDWLNEDGDFDGSERALAKMSGTTTSGNTQSNVGYAARHYGIIPHKYWPNDLDKGISWATFYKEIPKDIKAYGLKFLEYFSIEYERLPDARPETLKYHLKQAPIWVAIYTCPGWSSADIVKACTASPNHAQLVDHYEDLKYWNDLDHYLPFEKKLAWNYNIYYPYKLVVTPQPLVLKKNEEGETMKIEIEVVKRKGTKDYLARDKKQSSIWHRIGNEKIFYVIVGDFPDTIDELDIAEENIGSPIYLSSSFFDIISNFLSKLKGK